MFFQLEFSFVAFHYVKDNGINSEDTYPYKHVQGTCRFKRRNIVANCSGMVDVKEGDEDALKEAIATVGPVSVAIDATQENFMMYKSGVFLDDTCGNHPEELDHGVLVVGYGTEDANDYWIVKNSWSESWGENGYIRMARNKNNMCGIATQASYPLVK
jgi:cathepsin L